LYHIVLAMGTHTNTHTNTNPQHTNALRWRTSPMSKASVSLEEMDLYVYPIVSSTCLPVWPASCRRRAGVCDWI